MKETVTIRNVILIFLFWFSSEEIHENYIFKSNIPKGGFYNYWRFCAMKGWLWIAWGLSIKFIHKLIHILYYYYYYVIIFIISSSVHLSKPLNLYDLKNRISLAIRSVMSQMLNNEKTNCLHQISILPRGSRLAFWTFSALTIKFFYLIVSVSTCRKFILNFLFIFLILRKELVLITRFEV